MQGKIERKEERSPGGKIIRVQLAVIYEEMEKRQSRAFVSINFKNGSARFKTIEVIA